MKNNYEEIDGWCGQEITQLYDKAIKEANDGSVFVEIGCYKGKSTCYMIDAIKNSGKKINFFVIDNFSTLGNVKQEFEENLGEERLKSITFINEDSVEASKHFSNSSVDFIFIDTDHNKNQLVREINSWNDKVKNNGLISGHDYHHSDLKETFDILNIYLYNVIFSGIKFTDNIKWRGTCWWYYKQINLI
jgi:predicted O-methyltransferase YrrM